MRKRIFGCALLMATLSLVPRLMAQDIDTVVTSENRKPATAADEIRDPAERAAYIEIFEKERPRKNARARAGLPAALSSVRLPLHGR